MPSVGILVKRANVVCGLIPGPWTIVQGKVWRPEMLGHRAGVLLSAELYDESLRGYASEAVTILPEDLEAAKGILISTSRSPTSIADCTNTLCVILTSMMLYSDLSGFYQL